MIGSNNTISTKRLATVNGKSTYSNNLSNVACYLEPASGDVAQQARSVHGFILYNLICEGVVDLAMNDRVFDSDGNEYSVYIIQQFQDNIEIDNHTEALLKIKL